MARRLSLFALVALLMAFAPATAALAAPASAPQAAPPAQVQQWTVLAGGQSAPGATAAWSFTRFYPDKLVIHAGDTVTWKINSMEMHQVVFPGPNTPYVPFELVQGGNPPSVEVNPLAAFPQGGSTYDGSALTGSGIISMTPPGVTQYQLTFPKPGTYNYFCPMHSAQLPNGQVVGMTGSVTVLDSGAALPQTADQADAAAQAAIQADTQAAQAAEGQATQVAPPEAGPNGTTIYHTNIGFDQGSLSYMRFAPSDFTVHVGDTIVWTQKSAQTPHTVTLVSGGTEPELILTEPQAAGPPKLMINPQVLAPAGGSTYNGQGYYNSGWMPGTQDQAPGPREYRLTFTQPGTYEYICVLHDQMGMNGHITVLASGTTPGMPTTGAPNSLPLLAGALVALLLLLGGLGLRRRAAVR